MSLGQPTGLRAAPDPPSADAGLWSEHRRALTLGLVLTITLVAFEALAVSTIMPIVNAELHGIGLYGWVFSAFFLGSLLGIVIVGGLIDRGGLVVPFVAGLALFSIGLIAGGLAPSMEVLVVARFFQGLGGGAIPPISYVAIGRALPEGLRPRMFATLSTAWVLPGIVGPAISGAVAEQVTWRAVFLGLLPLIALAALLTVPALARSVPPHAETGGRPGHDARRRLPWATLVVLGAGLTVAGLQSSSPLSGALALALGLACVLPAYRHLTPAGTLRAAPGLPAAVLLRGVLTLAFFCADAYVPLALQDWRGLDASVAGIALTAATVTWTAGAWVQARMVVRLGVRRFVRTGFLTLAIGIAAFGAVLSPAVPVILGIVAWGIAGFGMGLSYSPLSLAMLSEATAGSQGTAASGLQLSDVLGSALGTGIGGAIIAAGDRSGAELWVALAGVLAVGFVAALSGVAAGGRLPGIAR